MEPLNKSLTVDPHYEHVSRRDMCEVTEKGLGFTTHTCVLRTARDEIKQLFGRLINLSEVPQFAS